MRVDQFLIIFGSFASFWIGFYAHDLWLIYKGKDYSSGWADGANEAMRPHK